MTEQPAPRTCEECNDTLTAGEDGADAATKWSPDEHLVASIMSGSSALRMSDLKTPDRCWAVAGMLLAGVKPGEIAMRLDCTLRLVRSVIALPMTTVCTYAQVETENWINEGRLKDSALRAVQERNAELGGEVERTRDKLNRMIDAAIVGEDSCKRCGTPWDKGNTYWHNGRRFCRCCNARRNKDYREARKSVEPVRVMEPGNIVGVVADAVEVGVPVAGRAERDLDVVVGVDVSHAGAGEIIGHAVVADEGVRVDLVSSAIRENLARELDLRRSDDTAGHHSL